MESSRRCALNASPRGRQSNSALILDWTIEGMKVASADEVPIVDLAGKAEAAKAAFLAADEILVAFPLYTDFVPGILKSFLDDLAWLAAAEPAKLAGKRVAWIVHSGFPESIHSEAAADWLEHATGRLGMECAGVVIKAGSEGFRLMPPNLTRKIHNAFARQGQALVQTGRFDPELTERMAKPRYLNIVVRFAMRLLTPTGILNSYWNYMLKKHKAYDKRFDAPYGEAYRP